LQNGAIAGDRIARGDRGRIQIGAISIGLPFFKGTITLKKKLVRKEMM
jgi:hypothetical protein